MLIETMLSPRLLGACAVYTVAVVVEVLLSEHMHGAARQPLLRWAWEHLAAPLLQAALVILFIAMAYPVLFGLSSAPLLRDLVAGAPYRLNHLLNALFVLTVALGMLPGLRRFPEWLLPLQGALALLIVFRWLALAMGVQDVHYWPGWTILGLMILLAAVTHQAATLGAEAAGRVLDRWLGVEGSDGIVFDAVVMFFQLPPVLLFSLTLGAQLRA